MLTERDVRTLRDMVELNPVCAQRFDDALRLANGLFQRADCVPLPYYTPHDTNHCEAIEKYLDQIIWGSGQTGPRDFVPTPEEAMYLLSAAWLHDIGMLYGIFPGERPEDLAHDPSRIHAVRDEHEMRTVRYIQNEWHLECRWSSQAKTWLSNICAFHRRHHPIGKFEPAEITGELDGRPIRLVVLAALLRLADACHENQCRAPGQLMALYRSLGMPSEAAVHWEKAKLIVQADFDHTNREVVLIGCSPKRRRYDLCEFDLGEIVDIVRQDIEDELQSVQQTLLRYPNTYFGHVIDRVCHPALGLDEDKQYLALWPYLLDKPIGSTETAAALAQMLLIAVKDKTRMPGLQEAWEQSAFLSIMDKTQELHPVDFMIRSLCRNVRLKLVEISSHKASFDDLAQYLEDFLAEIAETCRRVAEFGPNLIGRDDVLVVHGYCRTITGFLETLRPKYNNALYVVEYEEPVGRARFGPSQNERMRAFARDAGFDNVTSLSLAALPNALGELRRKKAPCKVLLSTHGVLRHKDFLCKLGSHVLVCVARQCQAQVIVFVEGRKLSAGAEQDIEVATLEKLSSTEWTHKRHPAPAAVLCLTPEIDIVPGTAIDLVVTDEATLGTDLFIPARADPRQQQDYSTATVGDTTRPAGASDKGAEGRQGWGDKHLGEPPRGTDDFDKLFRNAKGLRNSIGDACQVLLYAREMEILLGHIEEEARVTGRKYEARLAASLRDICRVHDPSKFSEEQAECLKVCVTALVEAWGTITREKLDSVRTRLLDKGLTWFPVTDKAIADLTEPQEQDEI